MIRLILLPSVDVLMLMPTWLAFEPWPRSDDHRRNGPATQDLRGTL
jgi:hypothetical protein